MTDEAPTLDGGPPIPGPAQTSAAPEQAEAVLRDVVGKIDLPVPPTTHTVDALLAVLTDRHWLSTDDERHLRTFLWLLLPTLSPLPPRVDGARRERRAARVRPPAVLELLQFVDGSRLLIQDHIVSCLVDVLIRLNPHTDRERLRLAFDLLVDVDAARRRADPDPQPGETEPPAAADTQTLEKFGNQILRIVELARYKIATPGDSPVSRPALVLWVLVDVLRDSFWLPDTVVAKLRSSLLAHLAHLGLATPLPQPTSPEDPPPNLDPATMTSVQKMGSDVVRDVANEIPHLEKPARAAALLLDAILRLSRDHIGGDHIQQRDSAIEELRRVVIVYIEPDGDVDKARRYARTRLWHLVQQTTTEIPWDARKALYHFAAVLPSVGWITPDQATAYYQAVRQPLADSGIAAQALDAPIWASESPSAGLDVDAVRADIYPQLAHVEQAFRGAAENRLSLRDVSDQLAARTRKIALCLGDFGHDENNTINKLVDTVNHRIREWEHRPGTVPDPSEELRQAWEDMDALRSQLDAARQESQDFKQLLEQAQEELGTLKKTLEIGMARVADDVRNTPPHRNFATPISKWFADILPSAVSNLDTGPIVAALAERQARTPTEPADPLQTLAERTRKIAETQPRSPAETVRLIAGLDQFPYSQLDQESPTVNDFIQAAAKLLRRSRRHG